MFDKFRYVSIFLLALVFTGCSLTPQDSLIQDLTPKLTKIDTPTNIQIDSNHSTGVITLTWDPVDNATFYTVEYEKTSDYLESASPVSIIANTNSMEFKVPSTSDDVRGARDKRYVFRVKATCRETNEQGRVVNSLESGYSDIVEGVIADYLAVTYVKQDNRLTLFESLSNVIGLAGDALADVDVRYYDVPYTGQDLSECSTWTELTGDGWLKLESGKAYSYTAVLFVNGTPITATGLEFTGDIDYTQPAVEGLKATNDLRASIKLDWEAATPASGVVCEVRYAIQKKLSTDSKWEYVMDPEDSSKRLLVAETSYTDNAIKNDADYDYRILTTFILEDESVLMQSESTATTISGCHAVDTVPKSFSVTSVGEGTTTGDNGYEQTVTLKIAPRSTALSGVDGFEFNVYRNEVGNDASRTEVKSITVEENGNAVVIDNIVLDAEHHKLTRVFYYTVEYILDGETLTANPVHATKDGESFQLEIEGTLTQIDFISDFKTTSEKPLAERVSLSWTLTTGEMDNALSVDKISLQLVRTDENGGTITFTNDELRSSRAEGTFTFEDKTAGQGHTYSYQLIAGYSDQGNPYDGMQHVSSMISASVLSTPANLLATENTNSEAIEVKWDAVEDASGYVVNYRIADSTGDWMTVDANDTTVQLTTGDGIVAGRKYEITVQSVDEKGTKTSASSVVYGSIPGPLAIDFEEGADYIRLSWEPAGNVNVYYVVIGDTSKKIITTIPVYAPDTEFVLEADSLPEEIAKNSEYPLSEEYTFAVLPDQNLTGYEMEPASWVRPPKNIEASKAEWNVITISWDKVDDADAYVLYKREHGSNSDWEYEGYILNSNNDDERFIHYYYTSDAEYDFTVASERNGVEGKVQNVFTTDESGEAANHGYPLMKPGKPTTSETSDNFVIQFNEVKGATKYRVVLGTGQSREIAIGDSNTEYNSNNGRITVYMDRVAPDRKLTWDVTINAINEKLDSEKQTSETVSMVSIYDPEIITDAEKANLVFRNLGDVIQMVGESFGDAINEPGDWYPSTTKTFENGAVQAESCWVDWSDWLKKKPGRLSITELSLYDITISGAFSCDVESSTTPGKNPLHFMTSTSALYVKFPYAGYDSMRFTFNNYETDNSGGSVSLEYVRNGQAYTVSDNIISWLTQNLV